MELNSASKRVMQIAAWIIMLAVSDLSEIIITFSGFFVPEHMFIYKLLFLLFALLSTLFFKSLRPLRQFTIVLLVLFISLGIVSFIKNNDWFIKNFNYRGISFFLGFSAVMLLDLFVALSVVAVLFLLKRDRKSFFLTKGKLDAPIEPVRWLGIRKGESWKTFGWIFAGVATAGVLIPTIMGISPSKEVFFRALPLFPAAVLFAAVNAFTEEIYFRASFLSTLYNVIGKINALLITMVFFGLSHWLYGSPPGVLGFLMTGFLAFLLGKSMLETKGFLWPWTIHFFPDVVIFFSYALLYAKS